MLVSVTQEHINLGKRFDPCLCPVGRAVRAACGFEVRVCPSRFRMSDTDDPPWHVSREDWLTEPYVELPLDARLFARRFDAFGRLVVTPFSFELDITPLLQEVA